MDNLKDFFYAGVGAAMVAKEKVEKELLELKTKGKDSKGECQKKYEEAKVKAKDLEAELDRKLKEKIKSILDELGVATKEDLEELKKSINEKK